MNSTRSAPPPGAVGALLAAIGLGIAAWYGWAWYQVPKWTEQEIKDSVELNLVLDLSRVPPNSVPAENLTRMRAQIRREVEAQIEKDVEGPRSWTLAGLLMGAFGLVQMVIRTRLARRR